MTAFYNEIDPYAARWLRNLISAGHIAPGIVDERSILDLRPDDLAEFTQCHFFAGIGVWSAALRGAGWTDDRPVWTGSCPCQPFSAAGKGGGFADERHLWPAWAHLIGERKPAIVFGEQVASKDGYGWLDLVQTDLEGMGYACGAAVSPAAGYGAPHGRHRIYFVAESSRERLQGEQIRIQSRPPRQTSLEIAGNGRTGGVADDDDEGLEGRGGTAERRAQRAARPRSVVGGVADADQEQRRGRPSAQELLADRPAAGRVEGDGFAQPDCEAGRPGPTNGFWRAADWLRCRDDKWRAVEPGAFPLAHGAASRVGRLRAYGNAICAPAAQGFIEAAMASLMEMT